MLTIKISFSIIPIKGGPSCYSITSVTVNPSTIPIL